MVQRHDFLEGVRAVIVEKDNAPRWEPATPEGVTPHVVDQILVNDQDELLMMTSANQVIRIPVGQIRRAGRSTKGVRLQRLAEGDEVIAIANLGQLSKRVSDVTGEAAEPI